MYETSTKIIHAIFFYNNEFVSKEYAVFENAITKKGITWKFLQEDVIKKYGNPKEDFKGNDKNGSWRRIVYSKMDFRFENNILVRISIFKKKKKEKVFSI